MLIYVAGPYRGNVDKNVQAARDCAIALWGAGHAVICPHANTYRMDEGTGITSDDLIKGDLNMLARCDAIMMLPGWEDSEGATIELKHADALGIPIYVYAGPEFCPDLHPTEVRSPIQARAFLETVMRMYRVHLQKNADYSPANILGTGEVGVVTRLWDKVARLMNLTGFRMTISASEFSAPRTPNNESIDDTYMDASVYSIIGLLLRRGQWGV